MRWRIPWHWHQCLSLLWSRDLSWHCHSLPRSRRRPSARHPAAPELFILVSGARYKGCSRKIKYTFIDCKTVWFPFKHRKDYIKILWIIIKRRASWCHINISSINAHKWTGSVFAVKPLHEGFDTARKEQFCFTLRVFEYTSNVGSFRHCEKIQDGHSWL